MQAFNSIMTPLEVDDGQDDGMPLPSPPDTAAAGGYMTIAFARSSGSAGSGGAAAAAGSPAGGRSPSNLSGGALPPALGSAASAHGSTSGGAGGGAAAGASRGLTPSVSRVVVVNSDLPLDDIMKIRFSPAFYAASDAAEGPNSSRRTTSNGAAAAAGPSSTTSAGGAGGAGAEGMRPQQRSSFLRR